MGFYASAPCKAILFGEHYAVWGAPALSIAVEPRNRVEFGEAKTGEGALLHSIYGEGNISPTGDFSGPNELAIYAAVAKKVFGSAAIPPFSAKFASAWKLKGVGASASLCAAFAAGCLKLAGKKPSAEKIFAAAQAGDLLAHDGKASGIDAKTVSCGNALVFQRSFSPSAYHSSPADFALPLDCSLLLIDTNVGIKDDTGKMIGKFASTFGISSAPQDLAEEKRQWVQQEYLALWKKVQAAMKGTDGKTLGKLMNENHALLKARGVSSKGIDAAVSAALAAEAHGAKITGAGGMGGAVLALCETEKCAEVGIAMTDATGFPCYPVFLAKNGACVD